MIRSNADCLPVNIPACSINTLCLDVPYPWKSCCAFREKKQHEGLFKRVKGRIELARPSPPPHSPTPTQRAKKNKLKKIKLRDQGLLGNEIRSPNYWELTVYFEKNT